MALAILLETVYELLDHFYTGNQSSDKPNDSKAIYKSFILGLPTYLNFSVRVHMNIDGTRLTFGEFQDVSFTTAFALFPITSHHVATAGIPLFDGQDFSIFGKFYEKNDTMGNTIISNKRID